MTPIVVVQLDSPSDADAPNPNEGSSESYRPIEFERSGGDIIGPARFDIV